MSEAVASPAGAGDLRWTLCGEQVHLLPERALYWPARQTLLIADPHLGKAAAFRAGGVPVPAGTTAGNLRRLGRALTRTGARRLVILGDLLHARAGRATATLEEVSRWRVDFSHVEMMLVRGNHDERAGDPPADWSMHCVDEPCSDTPFAWRHTPGPDPQGYALAGHLHPAVRLTGGGAQALTLPCFCFGRDYGLLPAFGEFTGSALIAPKRGDAVFVLAGSKVVAMDSSG